MKVHYFSWIRIKTGLSSEEIVLPKSCKTVSEVVDHLSIRHPALAEIAAAGGSLRYTVNRRYVDGAHQVSSSDEISLFPPVTGG